MKYIVFSLYCTAVLACTFTTCEYRFCHRLVIICLQEEESLWTEGGLEARLPEYDPYDFESNEEEEEERKMETKTTPSQPPTPTTSCCCRHAS